MVCDPVSIATLIGLGAQVMEASANYIREVKHVTAEVVEIRSRVGAWRIHLEALDALSSTGELTKYTLRFLDQRNFSGRSQECLAGLVDLLQHRAPRPMRESDTIIKDSLKHLKWPVWAQRGANKLLEQLDHLSDEIQRSMAMDTA